VVGGKPHLRQEDFTVAPLSFAFQAGAHVAPGTLGIQHAVQGRQIWLYLATLQLFRVEFQQLAGGFVGQRYASRVIQRQNRQGAGLDQDAQLEFGFLAQLDLLQVLRHQLAALVQLRDEEPGHREARGHCNQPATCPRYPMGRVEDRWHHSSRGSGSHL